MRSRRVRAGVDTDKLGLLERFGGQMLATARRYSANAQDAEDAYQRATEILLTHEPTGSDDDLCRWLRTTVKHEALAIRRRQDRVLPSGPAERVKVTGVNPADTEERAERFERLRQGAQALGPAQAPGGALPAPARRGLLLPRDLRAHRLVVHQGQPLPDRGPARVHRAPGRASSPAPSASGWRPPCRRSPTARPAAADLAALRPHLRHCPACRARLREYRAVPGRVAALVPAAVLAPGGRRRRCARCSSPRSARCRIARRRWASAATRRVELAAGQKVAAVATSAAIASGGGVAAERLATPGPGGRGAARAGRPGACARAPEAARAPAGGRGHPGPTRDRGPSRCSPRPLRSRRHRRPPRRRHPRPSEFTPAATAAATPSAPAKQAAPAPSQGRGGEFAP